MPTGAQRRAVDEHRRRLAAAGVVRFEVAAPQRDKDLVRGVAKRLAEPGAGADELRAELARLLGGGPPARRGGIWRALRASPLVGAGLEIGRDPGQGRDIDL